MSSRKHEPSYSWLTILGSAAFLACSWTWCIGMFFPVYLLRDYGPASFLVFALPNIIGAAGLAFVLARPGSVDAHATAHRHAIGMFSTVTLAFQWFFLLWLIGGLGLQWETAGVLGLAVVAMALMEKRGAETRSGLRLSILTLLFSLAMMFWLVPAIRTSTPDLSQGKTWKGVEGLAWFAPVSIIGFLLCPYLDGTFLEVRRRIAGVSGKVTFLVGFVGFFSLMLIFTWLYAGPTIGESVAQGVRVGPQWAQLPVQLHMGLQLGFTIGVHGLVLRRWSTGGLAIRSERTKVVAETQGGRRNLPALVTKLFVPNASVIASLAGAGLTLIAFFQTGSDTMSMAELIYRGFMAFYGVVFPAYILIAAWPFNRNVSPLVPNSTQWIAWIILSIAGCAFAWLAFVEGKPRFVLAWAGIMILAAGFGFAVRGKRRREALEQTQLAR